MRRRRDKSSGHRHCRNMECVPLQRLALGSLASRAAVKITVALSIRRRRAKQLGAPVRLRKVLLSKPRQRIGLHGPTLIMALRDLVPRRRARAQGLPRRPAAAFNPLLLATQGGPHSRQSPHHGLNRHADLHRVPSSTVVRQRSHNLSSTRLTLRGRGMTKRRCERCSESTNNMYEISYSTGTACTA